MEDGGEVRKVEEKEYMARASMIIIYDYKFMYRARQYSIVTWMHLGQVNRFMMGRVWKGVEEM